MYNRYGKQKVLNSTARKNSFPYEPKKNDDSYIYTGRFIDVSES